MTKFSPRNLAKNPALAGSAATVIAATTHNSVAAKQTFGDCLLSSTGELARKFPALQLVLNEGPDIIRAALPLDRSLEPSVNPARPAPRAGMAAEQGLHQ